MLTDKKKEKNKQCSSGILEKETPSFVIKAFTFEAFSLEDKTFIKMYVKNSF